MGFLERHIRGEQGVTLVELLVVLAIVVILVVAGGFEYAGWIGKYRVEEKVKKMYSDLMNIRARAIARNKVYFIDLPAGSPSYYYIYEDAATEDYPEGDGALNIGTDTPIMNGVGMSYELAAAQRRFTINGKGLFIDGTGMLSDTYGIVFVNGTDVDPDYNCIEITATRVNMGKWSSGNGTCETR